MASRLQPPSGLVARGYGVPNPTRGANDRTADGLRRVADDLRSIADGLRGVADDLRSVLPPRGGHK